MRLKQIKIELDTVEEAPDLHRACAVGIAETFCKLNFMHDICKVAALNLRKGQNSCVMST